MRADRLLSILLLLQVHRRMTARELAQRLEVSERTIHRDMSALGTAGVPVTAERGTGGGWALIDGYRTTLTGLNEPEIQALFLTRPPRLLADLGLDRASDAALIKLLASLPALARRGAEDMRQRIHIDQTAWRARPEAVPLLRTIQDAIWQDRRLRLIYARHDGPPSERLVDPLGLVAKGSVWYLVAASDGQPRTYRVSRIAKAIPTDDLAVRPSNFDLAAYWERASAEFVANLPRYSTTLRADVEVLDYLRSGSHYSRIEREEAPNDAGALTVEMVFDDEHSAREFILGCGPRVEVLAPGGLRDLIVADIQAMAARYAPLRRPPPA